MQNVVLHILIAEKKFALPLIDFMLSNGEFSNHKFLLLDNGLNTEFKSNNLIVIHTPFRKKILYNLITYIRCILKADKILLHSLPLFQLLIFFPWKWKKTFWIIHGADLYGKMKNYELGFVERVILRSFYSHITHVEGDSVMANISFKSNAKFYYSPMYLSNVVTTRNFKFVEGKNGDFVVLVGNSLSKTNNHVEILKKLKKYENKIKSIICPLNYGEDLIYRTEVIKEGIEYFGEKFNPIIQFLPRTDYEKILELVDVAVFDHCRQEGMGVTLSLLSLGKTVYMRSSTESYKSFVHRGFRLFDNQIVFKEGIKIQDVRDNKDLLDKYYNIDVLTNSYLSL